MRIDGLVAGLLFTAWACESKVASVPSPDLGKVSEAQLVAAVQTARQRVEREPTSAAGWGELGDLFQDNGWEREAAVCYAEAGRLDPTDFRWPYREGVMLGKEGGDPARRALERALTLDDSYAPAHVRLARLCAESGEREQARDHYQQALALDGDLTEGTLGLAQLELEAGQFAAARQLLEAALDQAPRHHQLHEALARACFALGDTVQAQQHGQLARRYTRQRELADPRRIPEVEPVSSANLNRRGMQRAGSGDLQGAVADFEAALALHPEFRDAQFHLGKALQESGQLALAEQAFQRLLELAPDSSEAHQRLAHLYLEQSRGDLAWVHVRRALKLDPANTLARCTHGSLLAQDGRTEEALQEYEDALRLDSEAPAVHYNMAIMLQKVGSVDAAEEHYLESLRIQPHQWKTHNRLGRLYTDQGRGEEALEQFARVRELAPSFMEAQVSYAVILARLEREDEAIRHFQALIEAHPGKELLRRQLGDVYRRRGARRVAADEPAAALPDYAMALRLDPESVVAAREVAWIHATSPDASVRDAAAAMKWAERAVELGGPQVILLDTQAAAYAEAGRFPEAVATARRALQKAQSQENERLVRRVQRHLEVYERSEPFRVGE